jgi:hypothetical protein
MDRRDFLISSSSALFLLSCQHSIPVPIKPQRRGLLFAPYTAMSDHSAAHYGALFLDFENEKIKNISTEMPTHHLVVDRDSPFQGFAVEKMGRKVFRYDLHQKELVGNYDSPKGLTLYGHLVVPPSHAYIYATAADVSNYSNSKDHNNYILVYEKKTMNLVDQIFLNKNPFAFHDCKLMSDQKTIATASGDRLYFFDIAQKKILRSLSVNLENPDAWLNHMSISPRDDIYMQVLSSSAPGHEKSVFDMHGSSMVQFDPRTQSLKLHKFSGAHFDATDTELFGLGLNPESSLLAISATWKNRILIWDTQKNQVVKTYSALTPKGVSLSEDRKTFIVATSQGLRFFSSTTGEEDSTQVNHKDNAFMAELFSHGDFAHNYFFHTTLI